MEPDRTDAAFAPLEHHTGAGTFCTWRYGAALIASAMLGACGDGGGAAPTVSAPATGSPMYGQPLLLTINGRNLDQGLAVTSSAACPGPVLVNTAQLPSTATTAYYQCTVAGVGAGQFVVKSAGDGATLTTAPFMVPMPQVTMTMRNGASVDGTIVITLAPDRAPRTVNNFLAYVNAGFYNGTVIHRVATDFVVQGGGYASPVDAGTEQAASKPVNAPIPLEVYTGLSNVQWSVAMARTSAPGSATSQFFINLADNGGTLDASPIQSGYAVFGSVTAGTGTVTSTAAAPCFATTVSGTGNCTPIPNVVVTAAVQSR
jgi:peptidyl-prolyl cis-trans isomerase A (cyclophilin A)